MYLVESPDRNKVNHVLSIFAGDEQPKKFQILPVSRTTRRLFVIEQTLNDKYLTQINDVDNARHEKESKHILFIKLAREGAHEEDVDQ